MLDVSVSVRIRNEVIQQKTWVITGNQYYEWKWASMEIMSLDEQKCAWGKCRATCSTIVRHFEESSAGSGWMLTALDWGKLALLGIDLPTAVDDDRFIIKH